MAWLAGEDHQQGRSIHGVNQGRLDQRNGNAPEGFDKHQSYRIHLGTREPITMIAKRFTIYYNRLLFW
jgi:hypothetical protein